VRSPPAEYHRKRSAAVEVPVDGKIDVVLPDGPPELDGAGWKSLLGVMVDAAEAEFGPEWRSVLAERAGP